MKTYILKKSFKEKSLVGIRTSMLDWDETIIGFVVALNDSYLTINEIDEYGNLIGNTIIAIDDIINIEINDRYQKRLDFILKNNSAFKPNNRTTIWKEGGNLNSHFTYLIENKKIITFYLDDENYVTGIIIKFDSEYIMISNIGNEGDEDGVSYYPINKLIGLRYDSIEEQKIKLLYENRSIFNQVK